MHGLTVSLVAWINGLFASWIGSVGSVGSIGGGNGWMMPAFMQKSAIWGLQLAIAVAASWSAYVDLAANKMCLFYWWEPDPTLIAMQPKRIIFPPHDASAWANQNYSTSRANRKLDTVVSYDLQAVAPDVYTFISNFNFSIDDMRALLLQKDGGTAIDSLACSWVSNNQNAPGSVQAWHAVGEIRCWFWINMHRADEMKSDWVWVRLDCGLTT